MGERVDRRLHDDILARSHIRFHAYDDRSEEAHVSDTQQVARRYHDAWTAGDSDTVVTMLSPDFRFEAGGNSIDGRDAFLDRGAFPADATVTIVAEAYQGEVSFQMYDATRGDRTVRVVEQLTVHDGQITSSVFVTDMATFAAFAGLA
jgi:ketosteroid isomerase-like protein